MIGRRLFVWTIALSVLVAPGVSGAQSAGKTPRIGVLAPGRPPLPHYDALRRGLRDLGYVDGQTIVLETRWDEGKSDRYPSLVADLIGLKVDLIVAGTTPSALAAKRATQTIPVVMAAIADPVAAGLVASLARPGGNITGMSLVAAELSAKRIEILKQSILGLSRVAVVWNPGNANNAFLLHDTQVAARSLGVEVRPGEVRQAATLDGVFQGIATAGSQAVLMLQDAMFTLHRTRIAELALKNRLPTMSGETGFAAAGGLMNYGPNIEDSWRRSAVFVDRILKGAKPADLPIEQPTTFELVVNLETAKALGLTIPPSLLLRATQVIE